MHTMLFVSAFTFDSFFCIIGQNLKTRGVSNVIQHIVCFKLKGPTEQACKKAADVLRSMQGKVEMIRELEVGIDFLHSERSYDLILQVTLDDEAALEAYQNHPYHVNVVKKHMHAVRQSSVSVDYKLSE